MCLVLKKAVISDRLASKEPKLRASKAARLSYSMNELSSAKRDSLSVRRHQFWKDRESGGGHPLGDTEAHYILFLMFWIFF